MVKKIIVSILTLILTFSVGLLVACAPKSTDVSLELNKTAVSVEKYMNTFLIADYAGEGELTWSSANTAIAIVDDGRIYGIKEGSTTVTVTDGKQSAKCDVTVVAPDPEKFNVSVVSANVTMYVGNQKNITPLLTYKNVPISGATFAFSVQGSNVSVSADGVITAKEVGLATVTVKSSIDGKEVSTVINVTVKDTYAIEIQQTNVVLYPFENFDGTVYNKTINCSAVVTKEGKPISVDVKTIKWSVAGNNDVITVDEDGLVTAVNGGSAMLVATCVVDGKTIQGETEITVSPIEMKVEDVVLEAGVNTAFKPNLKSIIGINDQISKIIVNPTGIDPVEILPKNNSFDMSMLTSGDAMIYIVTRNFAYAFKAMIYDGIISSVQDMKALLSAETGFFKFVADIDMADYDNGDVTDYRKWSSSMSFKGTIDGGNHVVKNFRTSTGLFKEFNGGTIKDISFTDVETIGAIGLFGNYNRAVAEPITIDNSFVSFATNEGGWYVGLLGSANLLHSVTVSNSIVVSSPKLGFGAVVGRIGSYAVTIKDCYLINTSVFRSSLNTNLSAEAQKELHDPKTNVYTSYAKAVDAYMAYLNGEIVTSEFVGTQLDALMEEYSNDILLLSNYNVEDLLTFSGKEIILTEDIDMATAYTDNDGVWTSTAKFAGTFNGQGFTIKNLKTNTGLFFNFNGRIKDLSIIDVTATANCGIIANGYQRTEVSDVWVENVHVSLKAIGGNCDWYVGLYGAVNIGSPIYLRNVYFESEVPGRAYIYGRVGSQAIDMEDCYFVGLASEYAGSFNENLTPEEQRKLHLPETTQYKFYKTMHDMYRAHLDSYISAEGIVGSAIAEDMASLNGHKLTIKAGETQHWYECSCDAILTAEAHYGAADCQNRAKCTLCNTEYLGEHVYSELKCDENEHWYVCKCGAENGRVAHFGGKPTCTELAICKVCETKYGELHNYVVLQLDDTHHWYKCDGCELITEKEEHYGGRATLTKKAVCEGCKNEYGEVKPEFVHITNANVKELLDATEGTFYLDEDIDMATAYTENEGLWSSKAEFIGTFDGQGHTIKNFKTDTGLFYRVAGTVKNVVILDAIAATSASAPVGILARETYESVVIENVMSTLKEYQGTYWVGASPLFGEYRATHLNTVTVKNSVLWNKTNLGTVAAFVNYHPAPVFNMENCYLIGGNEITYHSCSAVHPEGISEHVKGDYSKYKNATELASAYLSKQVTDISDVICENIEKECGITRIDSSNVAELLNATSGVYVLAEDIDMATAYTANGGVWTASKSFHGTFDGQGYTIKNLKTNTGLFLNFNGIFKNVSIKDVSVQANCGIIAKSYVRINVGDVNVDNVYVSIKETGSACDWYVGLFGSINIGNPVYLSNVYFTSSVARRAYIYGEIGSGAIAVDNCYFVGLSKEYARSLNTNISAEQQENLHLPSKYVYTLYNNMHEMLFAYLNDEITAEGVIGKAIKADVDALTGHTFSVKADEKTHWYECSCGEKLTAEEHYGDANCQTSAPCELCGTVYGGSCIYEILKSDGTHHWYECKCGEKGEKTEHFGGTATCTEQASCEVCGTKYGSLHNYTVLKKDSKHHWYQCSGCTLTTEKIEHFGGTATTTELAKCEGCGEGYGELKPSIVNISAANVKDLLSATSGNYVITEDIDMATAYTENGGVWASTMVFTGTLDGQGHTISNLKTSTGLFQQLGTTANGEVNVKNLAITGVQVTGQVGAISKTVATRGGLTINIDNVYVEHSKAPAWGGGGFFGRSPRLGSEGTKMNITNSVIYINGSEGSSYGLLAYDFNDTYGLNISNSYFVGAQGKVAINANLAITPDRVGTYTTYANDAEFTVANTAGKVTGLSEFVTGIINAKFKANAINKNNVSSLLTATSGVYVITEDIDMATAYTANGGVWKSTTTFNGFIYGENHKITNLKTSTGLFKNFGGTIKDLAIADAETVREGTAGAYTTNGRVGVIAELAGVANVTIENCVISAKSMNSDYYAGTLFANIGAITINVNDSIIYNQSSASAFVGYLSSTSSRIIINANSYVIAKTIAAIRYSGGATEAAITTINGVTATSLDGVTYKDNLSAFVEGIMGW